MSHHGTTAKVAAEMKEKLGAEKTTLVDIEKEQVPSLDQFGTVIIGGLAFCIKNKRELLQKRLDIFMIFRIWNLKMPIITATDQTQELVSVGNTLPMLNRAKKDPGRKRRHQMNVYGYPCEKHLKSLLSKQESIYRFDF